MTLLTRRAAADSTDHRLHDAAHHLHQLIVGHAAEQFTRRANGEGNALAEVGMFDGTAGVALALHDPAVLDRREWDACLLPT